MKTIIAAILAASIATPALAGQNCSQFGNQVNCYGYGRDAGDNYTANRYGNETQIRRNSGSLYGDSDTSLRGGRGTSLYGDE